MTNKSGFLDFLRPVTRLSGWIFVSFSLFQLGQAESPTAPAMAQKTERAEERLLAEARDSLEAKGGLSEEDFLRQVLSSSPYLSKIKATRQKNLSQILEQKYSFFDWGLLGNWKDNKQTNSEIDPFLPKEKSSRSWSLALQKKWPYGLQFNSSYLNTAEKNLDTDELFKQFRPSDIYRNRSQLGFKYNLTESITHTWLLKSFPLSLSLNDLLNLEKTEELALQALEQYWKTRIAWVSWQKSQEGLKTYKKLVRQTNSKKKYNFLQPGERPQILAEYQNIQKIVDQSGQNYQTEKKAFTVFLNQKDLLLEWDPKTTDSKITNSNPVDAKNLQAPPKLTDIDIEKTRSLIIQKKQLEIQRLQLLAQKSSLFPQVEFEGIRGWTPTSKVPQLELVSDFSFYEFSVQFKWLLFSKSAYQKVNQKKYELEESKIDFAIAKHQFKNQIDLLKKQIPLAYKNIERTKKATQYYKQAFKEIQQSFEQGRVDVFQLIQIEKQVRSSQLEHAVALSQYSLALAGLLALQDKLLEKYISL